ncbi:MAG: YgfZ/GcvT domain-containing protein [Terriglobales bacterium]
MQVLAQQNPNASGLIDSRQELTALVAGCGIYRPERVLLSLTGRDRTRWLNGMVSNNIRDLAVGTGVYAFVLTPQGHIQADVYAFNRGESLLVETDRMQAEALLRIFRKYIIMDKVEIEDLSEKVTVFAITGPQSADALASLGLSKDLGQMQLADMNWDGTAVTVVRGDNPSFPNYELWVPAEQAESIWNALVQAGAVEVHGETLETFRILCGIPKVGQDTREKTLPQETGQERALNYNKGCYIGQEIVERIRARGAVHRTFVGFEVEGLAPAAGTKIQSEGKDVGEITSIASEPLKGKRLALGYLRREFLATDKTLTAGEAQVKAVTLPFSGLF